MRDFKDFKTLKKFLVPKDYTGYAYGYIEKNFTKGRCSRCNCISVYNKKSGVTLKDRRCHYCKGKIKATTWNTTKVMFTYKAGTDNPLVKHGFSKDAGSTKSFKKFIKATNG